MTDVSQSTEEDAAWSSENSNTDEEDAFGDSPGPAPVSFPLTFENSSAENERPKTLNIEI